MSCAKTPFERGNDSEKRVKNDEKREEKSQLRGERKEKRMWSTSRLTTLEAASEGAAAELTESLAKMEPTPINLNTFSRSVSKSKLNLGKTALLITLFGRSRELIARKLDPFNSFSNEARLLSL